MLFLALITEVDSDAEIVQAGSPTPHTAARSPTAGGSSTGTEVETCRNQASNPDAGIYMPWKPFEPLFIRRSKSLYSDKWSFITLDQHRVRSGDEEFNGGCDYSEV